MAQKALELPFWAGFQSACQFAWLASGDPFIEATRLRIRL